ncbi:MAG TPA: hypothetical protein VG755_09335 [Nannocystaceae bacterium]|nr:hypothetical protein [Nannocystaceae bacterium]
MQYEQGSIAFLLSLAAATPNCDFDTSGTDCARPEDHPSDDDKDDDDDEETGAAETGGGTTGGGEAGGEASGGVTGDPAEDGDGGEASTTGMVEPPICQPYVDHYIECFPSGDAQVLHDGCVYSINAGHAYSPECGSAVEDWYACLVDTPCDVVLGGEPYCESQRAALDSACPMDGGTTGG